MSLRETVFDRDVLALNIASFAETLPKSSEQMRNRCSRRKLRHPITGIAGCALAASGQAVAAAPPIRVMNSRRFMLAPKARTLLCGSDHNRSTSLRYGHWTGSVVIPLQVRCGVKGEILAVRNFRDAFGDSFQVSVSASFSFSLLLCHSSRRGLSAIFSLLIWSVIALWMK
jgi:hypothetical protein